MYSRDKILFEPPELGCVLSLGLPAGSSKIRDRSPYGHIGTITGATWVKLSSGLWCLSFDGVDDMVGCGNPGSLQLTGDLTAEAWLYVAGWRTLNTIIYKHYAYELEVDLQKNAGGDFADPIAYCGDGTYEKRTFTDTPSHVYASMWYHYVMTRTLSPKEWHLYLNGQFCEKETYTRTPAVSSNNLLIGYRATGYVWDGYLAIVRLYNRALGALEVQNHFNQEKHLFGVW